MDVAIVTALDYFWLSIVNFHHANLLVK